MCKHGLMYRHASRQEDRRQGPMHLYVLEPSRSGTESSPTADRRGAFGRRRGLEGSSRPDKRQKPQCRRVCNAEERLIREPIKTFARFTQKKNAKCKDRKQDVEGKKKNGDICELTARCRRFAQAASHIAWFYTQRRRLIVRS